MISPTSNEMPSVMVHTPSNLEVSPNQFSTHQESDVSRPSTTPKIPISNSWTDTNDNGPHTDPEDEEIDVMEVTPPSSVQNQPQIIKPSAMETQTDKFDDTESSSGCDLAESDISDSGKGKLKKKWNKQKYNVAWRWNWLQLQSAELQHQLKQCDASSVALPHTINSTISNTNDATLQPTTTTTTQSLPSSPTLPKTNKKQPQVRHPLFPTKDEKKRTAPTPDLNSDRHKRLKQYDPEDNSRKLLSRSMSNLLTPNSMDSPRMKRGRSDRFNIDHIVLPYTVVSPGPPPTPKDVPTPKWRDFGSDPFENYMARSQSMESTSPCISPSFRRTKSTNDVHLARSLSLEFPKEDIQDMNKTMVCQQTDINTDPKHETLDSASSSRSSQNGLKQALSLANSTTFSLTQEGVDGTHKREFHLIRSESNSSLASHNGYKSDGSSSEEDTSDEAFMVRHFCRELLERRRLFKANQHGEGLKCPNNFDELPSMFWHSPEEYFKSKPRCRQQELRTRVKEKFNRIKHRYTNITQEMLRWEEQGIKVQRIMEERAIEMKQREAYLAATIHQREHREPRVRIIDQDYEDVEEEEEEQNSYCASSEEEEDFFDQYSESSDGNISRGQSDDSEGVFEFDDSDGEYTRYRRRRELTTSGRRKVRHKKRKKMKQAQKARRGRPMQLHQFSPEFGRWEIVRKTPPVDPITNQLRNIIYLRRVREHSLTVD